jgi:hypothetical protein
MSGRDPSVCALADAYRISARLCTLRTARGERVIDGKIGFTNRSIGSNMPSARRRRDSSDGIVVPGRSHIALIFFKDLLVTQIEALVSNSRNSLGIR